MLLRDATLRVELRFEPRAGGGSVLTQRLSLFGPNAAEFLEPVKAVLNRRSAMGCAQSEIGLMRMPSRPNSLNHTT
jgi:hypothetical protein